MQEIFEQLIEEKGEDYAESILMAVLKEQSLPPEHQEMILERFMMSGNMNAFAKLFLVNEEFESQLLEKWSKDSE